MSDGLGFAEVLTCLKLFEETHAGLDRLRSSLVYTGRGVNLAKGSTGDLPQVCLDSWRILGTSGSQARSAGPSDMRRFTPQHLEFVEVVFECC